MQKAARFFKTIDSLNIFFFDPERTVLKSFFAERAIMKDKERLNYLGIQLFNDLCEKTVIESFLKMQKNGDTVRNN